MTTFVEEDGVTTWYETVGSGEPVVMLHPGLVDSRAVAATVSVLASQFQVFTPERRGHGRTPDTDAPITFELMAADTVRFLESVVGGPARLVGVSDGATVAAVAAVQRPDLVRQLACVAGVCHRDGWLPEAIDPANEPPAWFATAYGELSPDGIDHFPVVVAKLADAHRKGSTLTPDDMAKVTCRTLVMVADDDEVTLEHAVEFYRALPRGELAVVPGTSHGLLVEKPDLCHQILLDFLTRDPVDTVAPVRRRGGPGR